MLLSSLCVCVCVRVCVCVLPHTYLLAYLLTYLLTPWCGVLLEKLTDLQLVKKFPAFHGTRRFITALTSVRHLSPSWASPIQSIYPHPTSWRSILILSTHVRLGLPRGLFPSGFPTKTLYTRSPHPYAPHAQPSPAQPISLLIINYILLSIGRSYQLLLVSIGTGRSPGNSRAINPILPVDRQEILP